MIVSIGADPLIARTVGRIAVERGHDLVQVADVQELDELAEVVAIVVHLTDDIAGICSAIQTAIPSALVLGYLDPIDQQIWREAEKACFDVVTTKGAVGRSLRDLIVHGSESKSSVAVCDSNDIAGRIGFLMEIHDDAIGDVSLWRIDSRLVATGRCPHRNVCLGSGEIEDAIVTCPAHGSRFNLVNGERVRGPSDFDLTCYRIVEDRGRVWITRT